MPEANSDFGPSERLGNDSREADKVLSEFIDNNNILLYEFDLYCVDCELVCVLTGNLNHKVEGFTVVILVYSLNSDAWTDIMLNILESTKWIRIN